MPFLMALVNSKSNRSRANLKFDCGWPNLLSALMDVTPHCTVLIIHLAHQKCTSKSTLSTCGIFYRPVTCRLSQLFASSNISCLVSGYRNFKISKISFKVFTDIYSILLLNQSQKRSFQTENKIYTKKGFIASFYINVLPINIQTGAFFSKIRSFFF